MALSPEVIALQQSMAGPQVGNRIMPAGYGQPLPAASPTASPTATPAAQPAPTQAPPASPTNPIPNATAPGPATGGTSTGGAIVPTTTTPQQPTQQTSPFQKVNGAFVDNTYMAALPAAQQQQLQAIINRDPNDTSAIPTWASDALTQMFMNASRAGWVDNANPVNGNYNFTPNPANGGATGPAGPPLQINTPADIAAMAQQQFSQVPGANAYGFSQTGQDPNAVTALNPFGWVTQANPGYAQVTGTGGQSYYVQDQNAPAMQQAFDAGNVSGAYNLLDQDGSIPGFSVWQQNDDGTLGLTPWNGVAPGYTPPGGGTPPVPGGSPANPAGTLDQMLQVIQSLGLNTGAAPTAQQVQSGVPLPSTQPYGPGNDLRATQINPSVDPRLAGTQGRVDSAAQAVAQGLGTPQAFNAGAESDRARLLTMQALEQMMSGPDRAALAADALAIQDERSAEAQQLALRNAGNAAAKFGRLGSGNVATSIGDYELARNRDRDQLQRLLANDAAALTMSDRQAQLSGALGVGQQMFGQDLQGAQFGLDSSLADLQSRMGVLGALSGIEGQQYQQGFNARNELRGERDFQNDMQQQALNDYIRQVTLQDMLVNSQFGRDQSRINSLLAAGFSGDPTNALLGASNQQANSGVDVGQLLALWAQSQGSN